MGAKEATGLFYKECSLYILIWDESLSSKTMQNLNYTRPDKCDQFIKIQPKIGW